MRRASLAERSCKWREPMRRRLARVDAKRGAIEQSKWIIPAHLSLVHRI
jgi:hypothetical protein